MNAMDGALARKKDGPWGSGMEGVEGVKGVEEVEEVEDRGQQEGLL